MTWDFRIETAEPGKRLTQTVVAGPPQGIGIEIVHALEAHPEGGTVVRFDHAGFAEVDDMFREVTMGWAGMFMRLKEYVETGTPGPVLHRLNPALPNTARPAAPRGRTGKERPRMPWTPVGSGRFSPRSRRRRRECWVERRPARPGTAHPHDKATR
ncbi:SRPBCC domain-containing protein [Streptomyces sp. NPDC059909]|uniref:SRPBCC domain-containing protein n=1 Tax=Streptomyces sp. NPDC059909 TaxID=3346998 RepID=UPI003666DC1E